VLFVSLTHRRKAYRRSGFVGVGQLGEWRWVAGDVGDVDAGEVQREREIIGSRVVCEEVEVGDQGDLPVTEPDVVVPEVAVHELTAGLDGAVPLALGEGFGEFIGEVSQLGKRSVEVADVGLGVATNSGWVVIACVRALVERRTPPVVLVPLVARPLRG